MNKQQLDEAWARMQARLAQEPASAAWTKFAERVRAEQTLQAGASPSGSEPESASAPRQALQAAAPEPVPGKAARSWTGWAYRQRRRIAGAAAAIVLGAVLATPAGNQALAALLNEFRMDQLTAVKEQDLRQLFQSTGLSERTMNRYGEFARTTEGEYTTYASIEELRERTGESVPIPDAVRDAGRNLRIYTTPSRTLSMKVKVNAINETMRKLGAETLLPPSIDGKPITITLGSAVVFEAEAGNGQSAYQFAQRPTPTVTVDEGAPVAEALEAVLQFPLIPAEWKQELRQSHVLDSGSAPLPIVIPEGYEHIRVGTTQVLLPEQDTASGRYAAAWTNEGRLYTLTGHFADRDAFLTLLAEMIGS